MPTPEIKEGVIITVSARKFIGRKLYRAISEILIPTTLQIENTGEKQTGVEKAESFLKKGAGLVVIYTHPSKTDTYRVMQLWKCDAYAERRCIIPIASHQFKRYVKLSAWPTGIEFFPIVTAETVTLGKEPLIKDKTGSLKKAAEGYGSPRFLIAGVKTLREGGTVILAPSATRTATLTMPDKTKPTDALLNAAYHKRDPQKDIQFGILVTGFEINGLSSYEYANGLNLLRRYTLRVGNAFSDAEILQNLNEFRKTRGLPEPKNPFDGTDQWIFETQLPALVPPAYLPK